MRKLSLAQYAAALRQQLAELRPAVAVALDVAGAAAADIAADKIGDYQREVGPFAAWAPLAESTKQDRVAQGFAEDEPLLRTGTLRDSISHEVAELRLVVGSTDRIAVYQEMGTAHIPPRSFLGAALVEAEPVIKREIATALQDVLTGEPLRRR